MSSCPSRCIARPLGLSAASQLHGREEREETGGFSREEKGDFSREEKGGFSREETGGCSPAPMGLSLWPVATAWARARWMSARELI